MLKIIDEVSTHKTQKLLEECSRDANGVFVCRHPERIPEKCQAYGLPYVKAISYEDYWYLLKNDAEIKVVKNIYIDELDRFVKTFVPFFMGYTQTTN